MLLSVLVLIKKRLDAGSSDKLCTSLTGAVWVMPAHGVIFAASPYPFIIPIAFIAGNNNNRPD